MEKWICLIFFFIENNIGISCSVQFHTNIHLEQSFTLGTNHLYNNLFNNNIKTEFRYNFDFIQNHSLSFIQLSFQLVSLIYSDTRE